MGGVVELDCCVADECGLCVCESFIGKTGYPPNSLPQDEPDSWH